MRGFHVEEALQSFYAGRSSFNLTQAFQVSHPLVNLAFYGANLGEVMEGCRLAGIEHEGLIEISASLIDLTGLAVGETNFSNLYRWVIAAELTNRLEKS